MDWWMDQQMGIGKFNRDAIGYLCFGTVYFMMKKQFQVKMQEGEVNPNLSIFAQIWNHKNERPK